MKLIYLLLIIVSLVNASVKNKVYKEKEVTRKNGIYLLKETNIPVTGILHSEHTNTYTKTPLKEGKIHGTLKSYRRKDHHLVTEMPHKDGKKNGWIKIYTSTGEVRMKFLYKDGNRLKTVIPKYQR